MSPFHRHNDPRALRHRIIDVLRSFPDGATCAQLAEVLGDFQYTISSILSKMHCYGGPIDKDRIPHGVKGGSSTYWRLKSPAILEKYLADLVSA